MQFLSSIFDVFSRRPAESQDLRRPVTYGFRNRILLLCRDVVGPTGCISEFWDQIHQKLEYLHGTPVLAPGGRSSNRTEDLFQFVQSCDSDHFLDFVEYMFQVAAFRRVNAKPNVVDQINLFFDVDGLPYFLTDYVEVEEPDTLGGRSGTVIRIGAYPKVVLRENRLIHAEAVGPALDLLTDPALSSANSEFLEALEDYRKRDFGDCLTKCASAIESVLKIICDKNGWPYEQTDTASPLLNTVISRTSLEPFFIQPLLLVATTRNRLSKSHGAGTVAKQVPAHVAQFTINATAAAILLLVQEAIRKT